MDKAHVEELASKHAALHALIDEEEHRPHPDMIMLHRLKKEKLRLKDQLVGHYPLGTGLSRGDGNQSSPRHFLDPLVALLRLQSHRCDRPRFEPSQRDRVAA